MVKWASIKTSTKVRGYVPSANILGGKNDLKKNDPELQFLTRNVSFYLQMMFFTKICIFLQNKSTKVRAGMPSAEILGGETTFKKKMTQNVSF